jgi:transcriptional regulator with XRE-family HTH domain
MKRSRYKIETPITLALKNMRNARGVSLIKASRLLGVKEAVINHYENGRKSDIPQEYIQLFVKRMGFTMDDWEDFLQGRTSIYDLKEECRDFLSKLDRDKLKAIHTMLLSFVGTHKGEV